MLSSKSPTETLRKSTKDYGDWLDFKKAIKDLLPSRQCRQTALSCRLP